MRSWRILTRKRRRNRRFVFGKRVESCPLAGLDPEKTIKTQYTLGVKRDQFIHELQQLLHSNEPGSLDKALCLTAQHLEISPEEIVSECCSRPLASLRQKLGQLIEPEVVCKV